MALGRGLRVQGHDFDFRIQGHDDGASGHNLNGVKDAHLKNGSRQSQNLAVTGLLARIGP